MRQEKLIGYKVDKQKVEIAFEGKTMWIEAVTPQIIRVYEDNTTRSKAIEGDKSIPTTLSVWNQEDELWMNTEEIFVRVTDGGYIDFFDKQKNVVCEDYRGERQPLPRGGKEAEELLLSEGHAVLTETEQKFEIKKKIQGTENFYGLGDKTGFLDKRHYEYEMWNTDNPEPHVDCFKALYKTIPFFITLTDTQVYGLFLDNTYKSTFNMGQESEEYYFIGAEGGSLDYYYIAGASIAEVLQNYTYLTGTCPLPQKWTLGYHQSRWGYVTQEDMEELVSGFRDNDIPCDAIHFDIDYMQDYKVFTWNQKRYHGAPKQFLSKLSKQGFKTVVINDPGVKKEEGYEIYEEGVKNGYFAKTPEGEVYINRVWPGDAAFPDFGNPLVRTWWGEKQRFLLDMGVRGIWNDMNEPASFQGPLPDNVVFTDEDKVSDHRAMHNVYGHLMAKAAYEGLKKEDGRRPFVITRACYAGSQKYSTVWTGDNTSLWSHLQMAIPQLCNLGLSGFSYAGTDIGGFGADTTPELLARWIQVGCFSPLFRNHSAMGSRRQEPWQFGQEIMDIYRTYVKLRYHLIPYIYDLFYEEEKTGAPIMRPLVFHYEKDKTARTCNDEFMLGSQILVAPVVNQGMTKRMVYLPEGIWYDYWTKERIVGPIWFVREAPLAVCPIYVKAGSVIPVMEEQSYIGEKQADVCLLEAYPGEGSWKHYLDNGEDFAYQEGHYHQYSFAVDNDGMVCGKIEHAGYESPYQKIMVKNMTKEKEGWRELIVTEACTQ